MRNGGHAHAQDAGYVANAEFFAGQGIDYSDAGRVCQEIGRASCRERV